MRKLTNLRTISLNNNKLRELPLILQDFKKLYSLSVNNNEIKEIHDDFFNDMGQIETLDLD